ncbi:hypothetical protein ACLOJK_032077 [Asimina triloba]
MACFKTTSICLVLAAVLLLAPTATRVEASTFLAYGGPGCGGAADRLTRCGCSNINRRSGYQFTYTGQTAATYNQPGCKGVAHTRFGSSARGCTPFGWRSVFIQC